MRSWVAIGITIGLVVAAAACSGSEGASPTTLPTTTAPVTTVSETFTEAPEPERPVTDGPLGEVCPETIVVQLDALPDVRTGPLFHLLDDDVDVDDIGQTVVAPLTRADGHVEDVRLELRTGGPVVAFRSALSVQADDPDVHFADASFSQLALATASDARAVLALASGSDAMIMWDPAAHPEVVDLDTLRVAGIDVVHLPGESFITFLAANGVLDAAQLTPTAGDGVAAFVTAEGGLARQGDALIDPQLFPTIPRWGRAIAFAPASSRGWLDVEHLLAATPGRLTDECLGRFVPVVQEAIVSYAENPTRANALMADVRTRFNPLTRISAEVFDAATRQAVVDGAVASGFVSIVGGFDPDQLESFAPALGAALGAPLRPLDEVITDRFLDPTI